MDAIRTATATSPAIEEARVRLAKHIAAEASAGRLGPTPGTPIVETAHRALSEADALCDSITTLVQGLVGLPAEQGGPVPPETIPMGSLRGVEKHALSTIERLKIARERLGDLAITLDGHRDGI
jgi:hypothetical protein